MHGPRARGCRRRLPDKAGQRAGKARFGSRCLGRGHGGVTFQEGRHGAQQGVAAGAGVRSSPLRIVHRQVQQGGQFGRS
ncbi:MAG: hypothetical protein IPH86_10010 [bacterium]|nr:hypothetical protein [bacterium]